MKGIMFKKIRAIFALISMFFMLSSSFAISQTDIESQKKIYGSKLGCMSCHQGNAIQTDKIPDKSDKLADLTSRKPQPE